MIIKQTINFIITALLFLVSALFGYALVFFVVYLLQRRQKKNPSKKKDDKLQ